MRLCKWFSFRIPRKRLPTTNIIGGMNSRLAHTTRKVWIFRWNWDSESIGSGTVIRWKWDTCCVGES
ncbi:MAG: hypothetical protein OXI05_01140, partial [Bacteroidota bacterium]|nr:hypothetical protein [Bacteroidota bacterium]